MSLILEALKKLEREKQAGERGLVVLSHLPWVGTKTGRGGVLAATIASLILVLLVAAGIWRWRGGGVPPTAHDPRAGNPSTAVVALPSAPSVDPATGASLLNPGSPVTPRPAGTDTRTVAIRPELPVSRLPPPVPAPTAVPEAPVAPAGATDARATPSKPGEVHLNAISVRDGHPVAILNDRLVREGDSFDGIRVVRIGEAEVEVEVGGVRKILTF
jgi:hypothetical protein